MSPQVGQPGGVDGAHHHVGVDAAGAGEHAADPSTTHDQIIYRLIRHHGDAAGREARSQGHPERRETAGHRPLTEALEQIGIHPHPSGRATWLLALRSNGELGDHP